MSKFLTQLLEEDDDLSSDNETERFVSKEYFTPPRYKISTCQYFSELLKT